MKTSELKQIIREEIKNVISEESITASERGRHMKTSEIRQIIREVIREELSNEEFQQHCHRSTLEIRKSANKLIKKIKSNGIKRK